MIGRRTWNEKSWNTQRANRKEALPTQFYAMASEMYLLAVSVGEFTMYLPIAMKLLNLAFEIGSRSF